MNHHPLIQNVRTHLILAGLVLAILSACAPSGTKRGTGEYIDDAAISSRIKTAFATSPAVKATEVRGCEKYRHGCVASSRRTSVLSSTRRLALAVFSHPLQVETYKGTVQLSGFVDSSESALRAAQIARQTPGVKEVRNSMVIRTPQQ